MLYGRIICFFSLLFCLSIKFVDGMESRPSQEFGEEELNTLVKDNISETSQLFWLLLHQEKLFDLYSNFIHENIEKTKYLIELKNFDILLLNNSVKLVNFFERFSKFIFPITFYMNYLRKNQKDPSNFEQKIKIIGNLYSKYIQIRDSCLSLLDQLHLAYKDATKLNEEMDNGQDCLKKNRYLISKRELGYNDFYPEVNFIVDLHNICGALETQGNLVEIIILMHQLLKKLGFALEQYIEIATKSDFLEMDSKTCNRFIYNIKKPESYEGLYVSYIFSALSQNPMAFEKLAEFALSFSDIENSEIKKFVKLAQAQSSYDSMLDQYVKLVRILLKIYNHDPITRNLEIACPAITKDTLDFLPCALFQFSSLLRQENKNFNKAEEFSGRLNIINNLIKLTEEFLGEFEVNKEKYDSNYKRLKNTLRNLVSKCPSSQLYNKQKYLNEYSLKFYCLDMLIKVDFLSSEEIKLILKLKENLLESEVSKESESLVDETEITRRKQKNVKKVIQRKKKKSRRKNQRKKKTNKVAVEQIGLEQGQLPLQKICLGNKRIAKKFFDIENDMTICMYCMKNSDRSAGKIVIYDDRVQEWFSNPERALADKEYAEDDIRRATSIPFHKFSKEVDKYALKWGFKRQAVYKHGNHVTEIYLPGVIERNGEISEGLFVYVIDVKMLCYHRFFTICDWHQKLADEWQVEFEE